MDERLSCQLPVNKLHAVVIRFQIHISRVEETRHSVRNNIPGHTARFVADFVGCVTIKKTQKCSLREHDTYCVPDSHYFLQVGLYDLDHSIAIQVNYANLKETTCDQL